jgi:Condensation domain
MFVLPVSFAEQSLWFLNQINPQTSAYKLSGAIRVVGNLDVKALEQSLSEIVRRHETLLGRVRKTVLAALRRRGAWRAISARCRKGSL